VVEKKRGTRKSFRRKSGNLLQKPLTVR